jgi:demethylmenaquinone methyltransferase/2-methoxy-6-polyprenyl-1,4-benzoquinol methylase
MKPFTDRMQTKATYDSLSRIYDILSGPAENRARQQAVDLLNIKSGDILLEIGCGTGTTLLEMGKKVEPGGVVYGVDLSTKMLKVSQKKLHRKGLKKGIEFFSGDAVNLPLPSRSVTGILMSFTIELFCDDEIAIILAECERVLYLGGRLVVLSMSKCQPQARLLKPYIWLHDHYPAWIDCRPILLQQTLIQNKFAIVEARQDSLFGLSIEIVLAQPRGEG